jgi:threonine dehydrogenase-like Zn-dependent dehydrogenase
VRAVTFQAPEEVRVDDVPEPELVAADDAIIRVTATGVCGSDLHIYHGRRPIDPGTTIGHEYVGVVEAIGDGVKPGDVVAVLGLGPVGLCAVQSARVAGAAHVIAVDTVAERLEMAERFGAQAVHLTEEDPRGAVKAVSEGRGADVVVEAVGSSQALDLAILMAAKCATLSLVGVAQPGEVRMNLLWIKSLTVRSGLANVIANMDHVLALLASGDLDPAPLVTHHMSLDDAPEAYDLYAQHKALKIVLTP